MCRIGNPKKKSKFICLKCMKQNQLGDGIQRKQQREFLHIKDLYCVNCKETTKNVEVRFCDFLPKVKEEVPRLHDKYYSCLQI